MDNLLKMLTDEELIRYLKDGPPEYRDQALKQLYTDQDLEKKAKSKVLRYGGTADDAREFWIEAILKFDERVREGLQLTHGSVHTYVTGIAKWSWYNRAKKQKGFIEWDDAMRADDDAEVMDAELRLIDEEEKRLLQWCVEQIKAERCRDMLPYWALNYLPEEIAEIFGLPDADTAKKETYRCRQRLKKVLDQYPAVRQKLKDFYFREK